MLQKQQINHDWIDPCNDECSFCFLNFTDILAENYLFANLSKTAISRIIRDIRHQVKKFSRGEVVAREGDLYDKLMIIIQGSVVGEMMDFEGRVLRVEQRNAPETVATAFIFGKNNRLPVTITALEDTKLLLIPREDLLGLFSQNQTVLKNFLDIMANRAQFLSRQLKLLGLHSIKGKIAHYLLDQVKKQGSLKIHLPHTQNDLAEMFGVARPSVARTLKEMTEEKYIIARGKNIEIINRAYLSALLK